MRIRPAYCCALLLGLIGLWQVGAGLYIHAKAWLAQELIAAAWSRTLDGGTRVRPWPWADTWPVARLRIPARDVDLYVLADASGRSLAFGPGHVAGTAAPGAAGNSMIAGHRDTHLRFLRDLPYGALLRLQTQDGRMHEYRLAETHIIDTRSERLALDTADTTLTLLTCYPFDALVPGGPLRYAAVARPASQRLAAN